MSGVKLTKARRKVLTCLSERAMDIYDLSDAAGFSVKILAIECRELSALGLADWMYIEDQVSITPSGLQALGGSNAPSEPTERTEP